MVNRKQIVLPSAKSPLARYEQAFEVEGGGLSERPHLGRNVWMLQREQGGRCVPPPRNCYATLCLSALILS